MSTGHHGTHRFKQPLQVGGATITDSSTKVTFSKTLEIAGGVLATGSISGTHCVSTKAVAVVTDADYTLAEGVQTVNLVTTGAGARTITLGANNGSNHRVHFYASSIVTGTFASASAEGTTTIDTTNQTATFQFNGSTWTIVGYHGTTGPV